MPTPVPGINSSLDEYNFRTTPDGLTGFVVRTTPEFRIEIAHRGTQNADFSPPEQGAAAAINAVVGGETSPSPTSDGLSLYFTRQTGSKFSILVASRLDSQSVYGNEAEVLSPASVPLIAANGQTLFWIDFTDRKLRAATRGSAAQLFTNQRMITTMGVGQFALSADELTLYYSDLLQKDIYMSTRANTSVLFEPGPRLDVVNSPQIDNPVSVSSDGCTLYIESLRPGVVGGGGWDIWQARKP